MEKLAIGNFTVAVEIIYRKRKTMQLKLESVSKIRILAPIGLSKQYIIEFIYERQAWICDKIQLLAKQAQAKEIVITNGAMVYYLGEPYQVQVMVNKALHYPIIEIQQDRLIIKASDISQEFLRLSIKKWYQNKAMDLFIRRARVYAEQVGKSPVKIKLSNAMKRWGSCSSKGTALLNWRLIMAPIKVVDYIVVHELCHLVYLNHSRDYWNLVSKVMPDFKTRQQWLAEHGASLYWLG